MITMTYNYNNPQWNHAKWKPHFEVYGMAGHLSTIILLFDIYKVSSEYRCSESCGNYAYCCGTNICCHHDTSYTFYSVWYFWFIVALLIMACAGSCSYCRKRQRLVKMRRNVPVTVVTFSNGRQGEDPVQFALPPSYQEATVKAWPYPPPYYTTDLNPNHLNARENAQPPPYPGNNTNL